jgi:putative DNA primase/helicase
LLGTAINLNDLDAAWKKARRRGRAPTSPTTDADDPLEKEDPAHTIYITTQMTTVVNAMQAAITQLPEGPRLLQRAQQLCHIARGVEPPKWLERSHEAPVIVPADPAYLRELAAQAAAWKKYDKRADVWEDALPPAWAIDTLLARRVWPFPPLEGVVTAPTLRPDGSVLDLPGYDSDTGLFLAMNGFAYPPIPQRPTLGAARGAIGQLQQVFIDFPWLAPHHFSATLAALLSLAGRYAIRGNVPLFAVCSTTRGSGKDLLVDAVCLSATGRPAPRWPQVQEEDEERKRLLTLAIDGDACTHIDNGV